MVIPEYIFIPTEAVDDDDSSVVSWQSLSNNHLCMHCTVQVHPHHQKCRRTWKGSKECFDQAIKMPHRCNSQIRTLPERDGEEYSPRSSLANFQYVKKVDGKQRHRLSMKEEALVRCILRHHIHDSEDESSDNDHPPKMPSRANK